MKKISLKSYLSVRRFRLRLLPIVVWLGAVACVVGLFSRRAARFEVLGIAQVQVHQIAATCDGRLKSVPVQLFQKVSVGDTVAILDTVLDDEPIEAELATIDAEIKHLDAQLHELRKHYEAEIHTRRSEWNAEDRAFTADITAADTYILELEAVLESDRMTLQDLELDIESLMTQERLQTDDTAFYELQKLRVNYDSLAKKIAKDEEELEEYRKKLTAAEDRRVDFNDWYPRPGTTYEEAKDVILKATKALEQRKNELQVRLEELVLKAPCDGFVSQIRGMVGEAALAGVPILTIAEDKPRQIIAYVSEDQVHLIREGMAVEVIKDSEPEWIAPDQKITYVGPAVEQMPIRLWRNPAIPQWGRPILIDIPPGLKLVPGEVVGIRGLERVNIPSLSL